MPIPDLHSPTYRRKAGVLYMRLSLCLLAIYISSLVLLLCLFLRGAK